MEPSDVTALLGELKGSNPQASSALIPLVYKDLRRLAEACMRRERAGHTLQATALVHEAYLKLLDQHSIDWQSRAHFFAIAAQVMRRVLIDYARGHVRDKRGGGIEPVPLDEVLVFSPERSAEFLELDRALERLAEHDSRLAKIVELRFFGGLTVEEAAEVLGVSTITVKRDWALAKAWLHGELKACYGTAADKVGNS